MVAANYEVCARSKQGHDLARIWAVVHQIPQDPEFVSGLWQCRKCIEVRVYIRNDDDLHERSFGCGFADA